jgi:hypothetical protein
VLLPRLAFPIAFAPLDGDGRTLLHGVARLGSLILVRDLVELFGACAFAEDAHGVTPAEYARARGFEEVYNYLQTQGLKHKCV